MESERFGGFFMDCHVVVEKKIKTKDLLRELVDYMEQNQVGDRLANLLIHNSETHTEVRVFGMSARRIAALEEEEVEERIAALQEEEAEGGE